MLKALDVTESVKHILPSLGDRHVAMSAGSLAAADNRDDKKRLQFVSALSWRLLNDPACSRQQLDEHQTVVAPPVGPRFVLIEGATPKGDPATVIVTWWEWAIYADPIDLQPEIEVLERDETARRYMH